MADRSSGLLQWLGVAMVVMLLDQFTKVVILATFSYGQSMTLTSFVNLVRVHNRGAAFSFLAQGSGWQRWFFISIGVAAAVLIVVMLARHGGQRMFAWSLALILGGAVGNVIDRAIHGYVVDFVDLHWRGWHFPAFNVADGAITVGAALLILDELRRVRRTR